MMLSADLFSVGFIGDAPAGSVVWPSDEYEPPFLIGTRDGATVAVALDGDMAFHCFPTGGNTTRRGTIIGGVILEIDISSTVNLHRRDFGLGQVVRTGKRLAVICRAGHSYASGFVWIDIRDDLEDSGENHLAYEKWNIVIGRGVDKQILLSHPGVTAAHQTKS